MIPTRLEITNFLSYRQTAVLDFTGIHLACISGANGAGKSSLLDAIVWVLFGQSRSRSDDDLVNRVAALDGSAAEVRLTFDLESSTYRVSRRKTPGKTTILELQMAAGDGKWKTLSEGKLRDTQAAIETLLRMNYDTFINASFLLQGKADEFTTKTPNRRKEILADLLGVSQWNLYRDAAVEKRKQVEGQIMLIDAQLGEIDNELGQADERQETLQAAQAELAHIAARLADKEAVLEQARKVQTAVSQQQKMTHDLANRLAQARNRQAQLQQTRHTRQQQRDDFQHMLDEADDITAAYAAWQDAEAQLHAWQEKADAFNRLQQAKRPFELEIAQARSRLEQRHQALQNQAAQAAAARTEREQVINQQQAAAAALEKTTAVLSALAAEERAWQEARANLQQAIGERELLQKEVDQLQMQAQRMARLAAEQTAVSDNRLEAEKTLVTVAAELAAVAERHQRHATALAEQDTLAAEQERLRHDMNRHKNRIEQLEAEVSSTCPLCGQPLTPSHRENVLADLRQEGKQMGDRFRDNRERLAALQAEAVSLQEKLKHSDRLERDRQTQQERLARAEARLAEIAQVLAEWQDGGQVRLEALAQQLAGDGDLRQLQQRVAELETAVQQKTTLDQTRQQHEREISAADARLAEINRLLHTWETVGEAELADVTTQLAAAAYAPDAQSALAELEDEVAAVAYDEQAHAAVRAARQELAAASIRYQKLQEVRAAVQPLEDALADLDGQLADQEAMITTLAAEHETAVAQLAAMTAGADDLHAVEDEVNTLREARIAADRRVGAAQQRLDVLADVRHRQTALREERAGLTQQVQRYRLLEQACGRNGVQALLIEQALPEIEERANELLERLTDGTTRVSFETQRQLKSRDALAETLDIRISDGAGERPYDNYSGGEQFRVNFAIRLALSQLLARRAGARLQTLVIDEGFGSQDPAGRQRLVEAINTIQGEFARILIITHVAELRDAFPTRIEVEKRPLGSVISVV